jgi:hypothetical protein
MGGTPTLARPPGRGQTALHIAAWNGDRRTVELLLAAGADHHAADRQYGSTPRSWAETAIEVTNNPACAAVATRLSALDG